MRSAKLPVISAGVIMANFNWNRAKSKKGIFSENSGFGLNDTPLKAKNVAGFPTKPPILSPKARLNPTTTQRTLITPRATKLCNMWKLYFFGSPSPRRKKQVQGS